MNGNSLDQQRSTNNVSLFMGTLLANLNFQLDDEHGNVASSGLKQDLTKLSKGMIPEVELPLNHMIEIFGYSDVLGELYEGNSKSKKSYDVSLSECSSSMESRKESSYLENLPNLNIIASDDYCDLTEYSIRWNSYFHYLYHGSNGGKSCIHTNI